jgi:hypothetical protein
MTRADTEQALNVQGARIISSEGSKIHAALNNGKDITVAVASDDKTRAITIQSTGTGDNPYESLKLRFGLPEIFPNSYKSYHTLGYWTGEPHIRLDIIPVHSTPDSSWRLRLIDQNAR